MLKLMSDSHSPEENSVNGSDTPTFSGRAPESVEENKKPFFNDVHINAIDQTFTKAIEHGLINHYVDDTNLDGRTFQISSKKYLNFATCSYFALEHDPRVKKAIGEAAERFGASFIMSRTYASAPLFDEFECLLGKMFDAYPVVTPSTTLGHFSFMSVMMQRNDVLLMDQQVHNSVQMASSLIASKAKVSLVKHNDMERLEQAIRRLSADPDVNNIWYAGDGIYSMFGDHAPVRELIRLLDKYPKFYCYLDDAHGMSIYGKNGRGFVLGEQDELHKKMIVAISLSKCFGMGCGGALITSRKDWQRKIRTCGPTLVFSSPVPPPMLGAGIALAKIHLSEEIGILQKDLQTRISHFHNEARRVDLPLMSDPDSPVQYVKIGAYDDAIKVAEKLFEKGFFVNLCAYPAVPKNKCGIRVTITRNVSYLDIQDLVGSIKSSLNLLK